jgi:hypothetical protein
MGLRFEASRENAPRMAEERLRAGQVVQVHALVRELVHRLLEKPLRLLVLAAVEERKHLRAHLPGHDAKRLAGLRSDAQDRRPIGPGDRAPLGRRVTSKHQRPRRGVDRLALDGEGGAPLEHEVELLVSGRDLVVLRDDRCTLVAGPGIYAEGRDREGATDRDPFAAAAGSLDLVEPDGLEGTIGHGLATRPLLLVFSLAPR